MRTPAFTCAMLLACCLCVCCFWASDVRGEGIETLGAHGPSTRHQAESSSAYSRSEMAEESNVPTKLSDQPSRSPHRLRLSRSKERTPDGATRPSASRSKELLSGLTDSSATTAIAALAFVVGLFLLFSWAVKRGMPRSSRIVPTEAVRVLGRVPLAARQFGHLLQVGNKIVLVSVTSNGIDKLVEIDHPQEVERLLELCGGSDGGSSKAEFNEVFGQFAKEPAAKGFLGSEATPFTENAADAYAKSAGGGHRA